MDYEEPTSRLSIELSETLHQQFNNAIPWGMRRRVVIALIAATVEDVNKRGLVALEDLLHRYNQHV